MSIKIGICSWCAPEDIYTSLPRLKAMGIDGVQLNLTKDYKTDKLYTAEGMAELRELGKANGIVFPSIGLNVFCDVEIFSCGDEMLKDIMDTALKTADFFGAKVLQVPAFGVSMIKTKEQFDGTVAAFVKMCDMAKSYGVIVGTENPLSIEESLEMLEKVGKENFKVYFDTQNANLLGGHDMAQMAKAFCGNICEVHCKDGTDKMGDTLLGKGSSKFFETAKELKAGGFNAFAQIENSYPRMSNKDVEKGYELLKQDLETMKSVFK